MKKLSILLLGLFAQIAQASHHPDHHFTGFTASLAGGGTLADFNMKQDLALNVPGNATLLMPTQPHLEGGSAAGAVGLGYSYQFHHHYVLAGEVTAGLTNAEVTHRNEFAQIDGNLISKIETKLKNDFAILFKPGYVIHEMTQVYLLVGPRWGNFQSTLLTDVASVPIIDKTSGYQLGVTAGIGLEHLLTNRLSLGLEYAYTSYGAIDSPETTATIDGGGSPLVIANDADIKASSNTVIAKLSYYF